MTVLALDDITDKREYKFVQLEANGKYSLGIGEQSIRHSQILQEMLESLGISFDTEFSCFNKQVTARKGDNHRAHGMGHIHANPTKKRARLYDGSVDYDMKPSAKHLEKMTFDG